MNAQTQEAWASQHQQQSKRGQLHAGRMCGGAALPAANASVSEGCGLILWLLLLLRHYNQHRSGLAPTLAHRLPCQGKRRLRPLSRQAHSWPRHSSARAVKAQQSAAPDACSPQARWCLGGRHRLPPPTTTASPPEPLRKSMLPATRSPPLPAQLGRCRRGARRWAPCRCRI